MLRAPSADPETDLQPHEKLDQHPQAAQAATASSFLGLVVRS